MVDASVLDSCFFGSSVDHFNQETGHTVLSLAEQIGRTVALAEALKSPAAAAQLDAVLAHLEALMAAETRAALDRIPPPKKPTNLRSV